MPLDYGLIEQAATKSQAAGEPANPRTGN